MNDLTVGEYISDYLIKNGMSILAFSKVVGIDDLALRRWIRGEFSPSAKHLLALADYFGISTDYLLGLSEEKTVAIKEERATFAERLKSVMTKNNVTAYRVAKECGIGASCVTKWLKGKTVSSVDNLLSVANYLGVSTDYLLGR